MKRSGQIGVETGGALQDQREAIAGEIYLRTEELVEASKGEIETDEDTAALIGAVDEQITFLQGMRTKLVNTIQGCHVTAHHAAVAAIASTALPIGRVAALVALCFGVVEYAPLGL